MRICKQEAAAEQIEQAIRSFFAGFFASTVTLAKAAEGSLPSADGGALFHRMKSEGARRTDLSQKELADRFNKVSNWLKHDGPDVEIDLEDEDAVIMILRAYVKYTSTFGDAAATPTMLDFEGWLRDNYPQWVGAQR